MVLLLHTSRLDRDLKTSSISGVGVMIPRHILEILPKHLCTACKKAKILFCSSRTKFSNGSNSLSLIPGRVSFCVRKFVVLFVCQEVTYIMQTGNTSLLSTELYLIKLLPCRKDGVHLIAPKGGHECPFLQEWTCHGYKRGI